MKTSLEEGINSRRCLEADFLSHAFFPDAGFYGFVFSGSSWSITDRSNPDVLYGQPFGH
jgi:hypothetical protein